MTTMKKKIAGLMALTMVATMSPMTAFADTYVDPASLVAIEGDGELEAIIDKEVFNVVLPLNATDTLDFTMDPQSLINGSGGQKGDNSKTWGTGTLFFKNTAGSPTIDYSSTSDEIELKVANAIDVDVSLTATVSGTGADKLKYSTKSDFTNVEKTETTEAIVNEDAHIYLAIQPTFDGTPASSDTILTSDGAKVEKKFTALDPGDFVTKYADSKYTYSLKDDGNANPSSFKFKLTGATNPKASWSAEDVTTLTPKISLVWNVKKHVESALSVTEISTASPSVTVTGKTVESVVLNKKDNAGTLTLSDTVGKYYTVSGTTYTFQSNILTGHITGSVVFNYNDGTSETVQIVAAS